jgi:hypothetical protein
VNQILEEVFVTRKRLLLLALVFGPPILISTVTSLVRHSADFWEWLQWIVLIAAGWAAFLAAIAQFTGINLRELWNNPTGTGQVHATNISVRAQGGKMGKRKVFLSYSSKDSGFADKLADDLRAASDLMPKFCNE